MKNILLICLLVLDMGSYAQQKKGTHHSGFEKGTVDGNWNYTEWEDKMTSGKILYAITYATETVDIHDPIDTLAGVALIIKNAEGLNYVALEIAFGQFIGSNEEGGADVRVRYDDEKPEKSKFYFFTDGKTNYFGCDSSRANGMIERIRKAKRLRIEAGINKVGYTVMEFNVEGLKWGHVGAENVGYKSSKY